MKKTILWSLLGLMVCMLTFTACSNDDDDNSTSSSTITGAWTIQSGTLDTNDNDSPAQTINFKNDSSVVITYADGTPDDRTNKWSLAGDSLRINWNIKNGVVDDYIIGKLSFSDNNTVTYTYTSHDGSGAWDSKDTKTIILKKK